MRLWTEIGMFKIGRFDCEPLCNSIFRSVIELNVSNPKPHRVNKVLCVLSWDFKDSLILGIASFKLSIITIVSDSGEASALGSSLGMILSLSEIQLETRFRITI